MIFHIPHSSTNIPWEYRSLFSLSDKELEHELLLMTDHFTDDLFSTATGSNDVVLRFPVSRLLVDPERFPDDAEEEMSKVGMGAIYTRTQAGDPLKDGNVKREELLSRYFTPHHQVFTTLVTEALNHRGEALIVDCHSFPRFALPYELNQKPDRPQVCIGVDSFHTPQRLIDTLSNEFSAHGLTVDINMPFIGAIVPLDFYQKVPDVMSVMIEIRRDIYMDESTGEQSDEFPFIQEVVRRAVAALRI